MKALVLAAGKGVRMRPLTSDKPKAMVLLKGKPLLEYTLKELEKAGIEECGIVIGHYGKKISSYFGESLDRMKLKYFVQAEALGTAHAVSVAEEWLDSDFLVGSADVIVEAGLYRELAKKRGFAAVVTVRHDDFPERYGVVRTDNDIVVEISEKPREVEKNAWVNAGIYRFSPAIFEAIRETKKSKRNEYELTDSIKILISKGKRVGVVQLEGGCMDIGDLRDLERAEKSELDFLSGF